MLFESVVAAYTGVKFLTARVSDCDDVACGVPVFALSQCRDGYAMHLNWDFCCVRMKSHGLCRVLSKEETSIFRVDGFWFCQIYRFVWRQGPRAASLVRQLYCVSSGQTVMQMITDSQDLGPTFGTIS